MLGSARLRFLNEPSQRDETERGGDLLQTLLAVLDEPAAAKAKLQELAKAVADSKSAAEAASKERSALAKERAEFDAYHAKHQATIDRERKEHDAAMAAGRKQVDDMKQALAGELAHAKADRTAAKELRSEVERRYAAFVA